MRIEFVFQILNGVMPAGTRSFLRRTVPEVYAPEHSARRSMLQILIGVRCLRQGVAANQERDRQESLLGGSGRSCFADQTSRHTIRWMRQCREAVSQSTRYRLHAREARLRMDPVAD